MKRTIILLIASVAALSSCDKTIEAVDQAFQCDVRLEKDYVYNGGTITIEISTNRAELKVIEFNSPVEFSQIRTGSTLSINKGSKTYESEPVEVEKSSDNVISITLRDLTTNEERSFNLDFKKKLEDIEYPTRIVIAPDNLKSYVNKGESLTIPVTVQPEGCSSDIIIRDITDGLTTPPPVKNKSYDENTLSQLKFKDLINISVAYGHTESVKGKSEIKMKFGKKTGLTRLRIQSFYNPTIYQDIEVYVREDVVILLELDGNAVHEGFYDEGYIGRSYGFAGYIKSGHNLTAKVRTFDILNTSNDSTAFVSSSSIGDRDKEILKDHWTNDHIQLNKPEYPGNFTITFYTKCQPETRTSSFFYGACRNLEGGWGGYAAYKNYYRPESSPKGFTAPVLPSEKVVVSSLDDGVELETLTKTVNECNDVQAFDYNYGGSDNLHPTEWKEFDIYHRNEIEYDRSHFNVRYIIYTYKCKTGTGNDQYIGGGRPWFLSDVMVSKGGGQNKIVGNPDVWCYNNEL